MTLRSQLIQSFKDNSFEWIHKGRLLKYSFVSEKGAEYMPSSVDNILRKMQRQHIIAVRHDKNNISVEYKWIPIHLRNHYIPYNNQENFPSNWKELGL